MSKERKKDKNSLRPKEHPDLKEDPEEAEEEEEEMLKTKLKLK